MTKKSDALLIWASLSLILDIVKNFRLRLEHRAF